MDGENDRFYFGNYPNTLRRVRLAMDEIFDALQRAGTKRQSGIHPLGRGGYIYCRIHRLRRTRSFDISGIERRQNELHGPLGRRYSSISRLSSATFSKSVARTVRLIRFHQRISIKRFHRNTAMPSRK